jgi:hypothetical protein
MNCRKCGTELPAGAMFCAECGTTVTVPRLVEPQTRTRPGDTAIIQPLDLNASAPEFLEPDFGRVPVVPVPVVPVPVVPVPVVAPPVVPAAVAPDVVPPAPAYVETTPARPPTPPVAPDPVAAGPVAADSVAADSVAVGPVVADSVVATPAVVDPVVAAPAPQHPKTAAPAPAPAAPPTANASFDSQHDDVEATRIVRNRQGDRFVLQFSTGENSTVFGTGLIGRNPVMQPGEFVDQLVTIVDSGKSVSKTHLEFGQVSGVFWIVDRFSANGTVVRQPDVRPQRLDPGKRQTIARGTRVDIGEQFFVVS